MLANNNIYTISNTNSTCSSDSTDACLRENNTYTDAYCAVVEYVTADIDKEQYDYQQIIKEQERAYIRYLRECIEHMKQTYRFSVIVNNFIVPVLFRKQFMQLRTFKNLRF